MTDLYVKPTDTHQFLDPSSSHLYHCKKGVPYSQAVKREENLFSLQLNKNYYNFYNGSLRGNF